MRKKLILTVLFLANTAILAQSRQDLYEIWQNPPLEYRMNKNIHHLPSDQQGQNALIENTLANGWGGFSLNVSFSHYLTDNGMKTVRQFCESAKAKGMDLWLYDEQGYPSGSAGGRVLKQNIALESMGIFFTDAVVSGGLSEFKVPPGRPIQISAFPIINGEADYTRSVNLSDYYDGSQVHWDAPEGKWKLFAATKNSLYKGFQADRNSYPYPSLLIPEVTEIFLDTTHNKYAEYLGNNLGRYFTSTFTDEPSTMAMQFHSYSEKHAVIPWQEVLSSEMATRYGYRPEDRLVELFYYDGSAGQQVRYQYFKTVGDLISENYFGKIKIWCEEHNFLSGGHLLLEETMLAHVPLYGNIMQCFRQMNAPGIDILSCYPENFPVHSPKLASSAAELEGQSRVMSEPCPVADGDSEPPMESLRGFVNMLLLEGVTDFNCYLKLNGLTQEEQIEFNKYVGRIGMLLRGGYTSADIGVVYPIESLWTKYKPGYQKVSGWKHVIGASEEANSIDKAFKDVSRFMYDYRWEYMHLDSQAIIDSIVDNGNLTHGNHQFKVIVLPAVDTLPIEAWKRLLRFAQQGGKLIFLEAVPCNSEIAFPDTYVQAEFARMIKENKNVLFMKEWASEGLDNIISKWVRAKVLVEEKKLPLRLAHKKVGSDDVFFLINDSHETIRTNIEFNIKGRVEQWDPESGKVSVISGMEEILLMPYHGKVYMVNTK